MMFKVDIKNVCSIWQVLYTILIFFFFLNKKGVWITCVIHTHTQKNTHVLNEYLTGGNFVSVIKSDCVKLECIFKVNEEKGDLYNFC